MSDYKADVRDKAKRDDLRGYSIANEVVQDAFDYIDELEAAAEGLLKNAQELIDMLGGHETIAAAAKILEGINRESKRPAS